MAPLFQQPFMSGGFPSMNRAGAVGGWVELARTTLGSDSPNIDVTSIPDKKYYMLLGDFAQKTTTGEMQRRYNNVTSGYSYRTEIDTNDSTSTGSTELRFSSSYTGNKDKHFTVGFVANTSSVEKLSIDHSVLNKDGAYVPEFCHTFGKWANTSNAISSIKTNFGGSFNLTAGNEVVVLGYDPADTHTNNFWEEIGDASGTSVSEVTATLTSSKKYLWVQGYQKHSGTGYSWLQFNGDTGNNYAHQLKDNGGGGGSGTNEIYIYPTYLNVASGATQFFNMFIQNVASKEKGIIMTSVTSGTSGGAAPNRSESGQKWKNTSNQISSIKWNSGSGSFADVHLKVWGAD